MTTNKEIVAGENEISLEAGLLESLTSLRDTLRAGERLEKKYTVRTIEIELEPQEYTPEQIKAIRELFNSSQPVFAELLGVATKTLQSWEHGQKPPKIACRMLDLMRANPSEWLKLLKESREPQAA